MARSPVNDPFETGFTTGQRNIFRQAFQKRADASLVKVVNLKERYSLKFTFDVYNLTNTTSLRRSRKRSLTERELRCLPRGRHNTVANRMRRRRLADQQQLL